MGPDCTLINILTRWEYHFMIPPRVESHAFISSREGKDGKKKRGYAIRFYLISRRPACVGNDSRRGLNPDRIRVVIGAAGGTKWLVLRHLDEALFSHFFAKRTMPLFLIGSSIGAWRFVVAAMPNPAEAIARFERAYCDQRYAAPPTTEEVTMVSRLILDEYIGDEGPARILIIHRTPATSKNTRQGGFHEIPRPRRGTARLLARRYFRGKRAR